MQKFDGLEKKLPLVAAVLILLWFTLVVIIKIVLFNRHVVSGDVFLWADAIAHTDFSGHFLYVATLQYERGILTLLQDHFEPSSSLLALFAVFSNIPIALIVFQGLAPLALVGGLVAVAR